LEEFDNFMDVDIALFYPKANGKWDAKIED
jgi:hypothetical protein